MSTENPTTGAVGPDATTVGSLSPTAVAEAATAPGQDAILARLDAMGAQLTAMSAELEASRRHREMMSELVETMNPVAAGIMERATAELEDLSADVTVEDLGRFSRTALRSVPQMTGVLDQVDSVTEFAEIASHLSGPAMAKLTDVLQTAEDRGYFMFAREGAAIADKVVTSYTEEDVRALGDNVVTIINAIKELTQPEVMSLLNRTALTIQEVEDTPMEPPGMMALLKSMRDPQTRRGLARVLSMLHTVGEESQPTPPTK